MAELVSCCESAVERCEEQERERLNLPWACYDLSRLNLVLGRYREAVETAHRAVRESSAEWMIETSLGGVDRIASYQKSEEWNKGVEEARRVLADGLAALAAARAPEEGA
jgi:hypothetical protein